MIEAIASNGDTEGAYDLLHQVQDDDQCRGTINSVIYCSVLKGFAREKKMARALKVYEEVRKKGIELSILMYNTLIDSCARCGCMDHIEGIWADMKALGVDPNVVTYSTMIKGYCQNGDMRKGFLIFERLKKDGNLKPDEIMYNSLLDGCARNVLVDEGLHLVEEMQTEGVQPTNFTLSILVKLLGRGRRLEQAFTLVTDITKKYKFRANGHVYTNLIQSCVAGQQLSRGIKILEEMMNECIAPDTRTYAILVRASISKRLFEQAASLLEGALGLPGTFDFLQVPVAICHNLDNSLVNEVLYSLAENGRAQDLAAPLLTKLKQNAQTKWVRIDAETQRKVMSPWLPSEGSEHRQAKGKGRGGSNRR
jgi:pentatricopeptide repeat protein